MLSQRGTTSNSAGQCSGPDQLRGDLAQLGVGSLGGMGEHSESCVLFDPVPLYQDAFSLFD
jgi:hypothetical protein